MATILVLDDIPDAVLLLQKILSRKGHRVYAFSDEEEAMAFAADNRLDLAILDIKLKKIGGIPVLAFLKRLAPPPKVMMLTGYPTLDTAREALALGAEEYCVKPIDKKELEDKVALLLGT